MARSRVEGLPPLRWCDPRPPLSLDPVAHIVVFVLLLPGASVLRGGLAVSASPLWKWRFSATSRRRLRPLLRRCRAHFRWHEVKI